MQETIIGCARLPQYSVKNSFICRTFRVKSQKVSEKNVVRSGPLKKKLFLRLHLGDPIDRGPKYTTVVIGKVFEYVFEV